MRSSQGKLIMLGKHQRKGRRVTVKCSSKKDLQTASRWDTHTVLGVQKHLLRNGMVSFNKPLILSLVLKIGFEDPWRLDAPCWEDYSITSRSFVI